MIIYHLFTYFSYIRRKIEEKEKPDVFIVGVEDALLPMTKDHHFNYGMYAAEIFNAFTPDVAIVSLINGAYNDDFYKDITSLCKYKYNFDIDAFFISNYVPISNSMFRSELSFVHTEKYENVTQKYQLFDEESIINSALYEFVKNKLLQFGRCNQY